MAALAELRVRVERALGDATNQRFSEPDLDAALLLALGEYGGVLPQRKVASLTLTADGREIDLASLTNLVNVERVEWDYDASDPDYPPLYRPFHFTLPPSSIILDTDDEPQSGDVVRVFYTAAQTIENLDGATQTSVPSSDEHLLVYGAAGHAALSRAASLLEKVSMDQDATVRLQAWGKEQLASFRARLEFLSSWRTLAQDPRVGGWNKV